MGFGEKTFLLKNADVNSHVTYERGSLKKKCSEYVDKHLYQVSCFFHNLKYFSLNFPTNKTDIFDEFFYFNVMQEDTFIKSYFDKCI